VPRTRPACLLFFCLAASLCGVMHSQETPQLPPQIRDRQGNVPSTDVDEGRDRITRDMAKKANQERQAALKNDAEKLLKLAVELKAYVDKSNENVLSLDVLKKAEEIEKLAHSVKDKMKGPN
jgi:hypothetical protein